MNDSTFDRRNERSVVDFDERRPSETVIRAVAEAEDARAATLETPLYDAIEPDALDRLFSERPRPVNITFEFYGHEVVVEREGRVVVR